MEKIIPSAESSTGYYRQIEFDPTLEFDVEIQKLQGLIESNVNNIARLENDTTNIQNQIEHLNEDTRAKQQSLQDIQSKAGSLKLV